MTQSNRVDQNQKNLENFIREMRELNARTLVESLSVECDDESLIDRLHHDDGSPLSVVMQYPVVKENPNSTRFKFGKTIIPTEYVLRKLLILAGRTEA